MVLPLIGATAAGIGTAAALRKGINDYTKKEIKENLPKAGPKKHKRKLKGYKYGWDTLVKGPKYKNAGGKVSKAYSACGATVITGRG
jgi:hypothetical protein